MVTRVVPVLFDPIQCELPGFGDLACRHTSSQHIAISGGL